MATIYALSTRPDDTGAGTSWATAKQTLAAANTAATAGDTIMCHGRFVGTVPATKQVFWVGFGGCVFDGNAGGSFTPAAGTGFTGIEFTNFPGRSMSCSSYTTVRNCSFHNLGTVFAYVGSSFFENCQFYNCTGLEASTLFGAIYVAQIGNIFKNCVAYANTVDLYMDAAHTALVYNSCFGSPIMIKGANASSKNTGDWNCFDFTNGKCISNSVDKTTLADWQAAMGSPNDANSIDRVWRTDVGDYANNAFRSNPSGYLLTAGPMSTPEGLYLPGLTVSHNTNATMWSGGVFVNTEIDSNGYIVLSAGQSTGTAATAVIDLGAAIQTNSIELSVTGEDATHYIDTDTGDTPNFYNIEFRGSNSPFIKTDSSPSWTIMPRKCEIGAFLSPNAFRYIQVRVTLRG